MCCDLVEKFRQSNEQCLGVGDIRRWGTPSINDRPIHTDDAGLDLRATDIDRQDVLHERHRRAASDQPPRTVGRTPGKRQTLYADSAVPIVEAV